MRSGAFGQVLGLNGAGGRKRISKRVRMWADVRLGAAYRSFLGAAGKVRFLGITGSCGKTTTAELVAGVLSREGRTRKCVHLNVAPFIGRALLKVRRGDDFFVCEVSAHRPGAMGVSARLLRPDIGVVLNVARDHYGHYRSLDATAAEKAKLIESLGSEGVAVLNADDPYVYAMRKKAQGRVITYGMSEEADVRGENVYCAWPERLRLEVCYEGRGVTVQTQLLGEHWANAVLATVATGIAAGVEPERAAKAIAGGDHVPSRMSEHETGEGVVFVRDDYKSPLWTVGSCVDFLSKARAKRRILVMGSVSDTPKNEKQWRHFVAREASGAVDELFFVGAKSHLGIRKGAGCNGEKVKAFGRMGELDSYLKDYLRAGDLVLLKGTQQPDHLDRLLLSRTGDVGCWRDDCGRARFCGDCRYVEAGSGD